MATFGITGFVPDGQRNLLVLSVAGPVSRATRRRRAWRRWRRWSAILRVRQAVAVSVGGVGLLGVGDAVAVRVDGALCRVRDAVAVRVEVAVVGDALVKLLAS